MENIYFYIEDCDGGFIVDAEYIETKFDSTKETFICTGTKQEIEDYIDWLCNNDIQIGGNDAVERYALQCQQEELCQSQAFGEYLVETEEGIKYVYIPPSIH